MFLTSSVTRCDRYKNYVHRGIGTFKPAHTRTHPRVMGGSGSGKFKDHTVNLSIIAVIVALMAL